MTGTQSSLFGILSGANNSQCKVNSPIHILKLEASQCTNVQALVIFEKTTHVLLGITIFSILLGSSLI